MKIEPKIGKRSGMFLLMISDRQRGKIEFRLQPDTLTILHTEVDDELTGQGYGHRLVDATADYAREHDLRIKPLCPFARKIMTTDAQYNDVLI